MEPRYGGGRGPSASRPTEVSPDAVLHIDLDLDLAGLTDEQRRAVESPASALCVLAGAGSGKTRVLTLRVARRIRDGSAEADHTVVCTFTRRAARELRDRLRRYGVPVAAPATKGGRPPGPGVRAGTLHQLALTLLRRRDLDAGRPPLVIFGERTRLVRELVGDPALASALAAEIGWAKARRLGPRTYAEGAHRAGRHPVVSPEQVRDTMESYQQALARRRAADFDDLLDLAADALETDAAFAEAARWRYRHLSVDEFQDVNPGQFRLVRALAGTRLDLCAVGDPNQAIYGWNGADPRLLDRLPAAIPGLEVVRLDENHRSTPQVVRAAAEALGNAVVVPPRSTRDDGPLPVVTVYDDEDAEADGIASHLMDRADAGGAWSEHAVLARTNDQLQVVGRALARAGIPYRMAAGPEEPVRPDEDAGTGNSSGLDDPAEVAEVVADTDHLRGGRTEAGWAPPGSVEHGGDPAGLERRGNSPGVVELATFHRAKGLEWNTVFVAGLEEGFVPIAYATGPAALAEEQRLLYVALTRAAAELHCSWARLRKMGAGRRREREPSPWLEAVARVSRPGVGRIAPGQAGRRIAELRAVLNR